MCITFSQFLINLTNENEYSGPFIVSILEVRNLPSSLGDGTINTDLPQLMGRWLKIDQETVEKTKMDKLLSRLVKKEMTTPEFLHRISWRNLAWARRRMHRTVSLYVRKPSETLPQTNYQRMGLDRLMAVLV